MGLDVYLYRYEDYEDTVRREKDFNDRCEALWNELYGEGFTYEQYHALPQERQDEYNIRKRVISDELRLDQWGDDGTTKQKVELPSAKYPEHLYKIGYWRSSYNAGGINNRFSTALDKPGLYYVAFGSNDRPDEYHVRLDWHAARARAVELLGLWNAYVAEHGDLAVMEFAPNMFGWPQGMPPKPSSQREALEQFLAAKNRHGGGQPSPFGNSFSNYQGEFMLDAPLRVRAILHGTGGVLGQGQSCVYVVYENGTEDGGNLYSTALEVVIETCDYVLKQPNQEQFVLHWSG